MITDKEIETFLKECGEKVRANESDAHCELMMDNHRCIKYKNKQWYIPKESIFKKESNIIHYLNENFSL